MASITSGSRQPPLNLPACTIVQLTPLHEASAQLYLAPDGTAAGGLRQAGKQLANIASPQADEKPTQPMPPTDQTAKSLSQPSIMAAALKQARDLQQWLLSNPHDWDVLLSNKRHHSSPGIVQVMAQPALQLEWQHGSTQGMVPVVCVPCDGQGSSSLPPPPFIANFSDNSGCGIVWKEPDWPWSSIAGQWHSMEWAANGPQGQLVLGLKAASRPCPAGAGGTGPPGSATRAAAAPAAPSHPGPSLRQPACTGVRGRPGRASGAGPAASIYDFVMPLRQAASAEPAVKPAMHSRPAGRTPPAPPGWQLRGGSSAPTVVGPAPVVPPAGQAAGSMPQPGTVRDLIRLAKVASDQLLGSPNAVPITMQIINSVGKPYFLHVSDQTDVGVDCGLNRAAEVVPVLCVPSSSWPNPPQPPPPFHIRRLANERCYVLWVDPHQPWSAVARGWEKVMWALYRPDGQLVVGLPAAGSSGLLPNSHPTPALMQQPTHPSQQPAPQQHHPPAPPALPCPSHPQVASKTPSTAKGPNSHPTPAFVQQPTHPTQQPAYQQHLPRAEQAQVAQPLAGGTPGAAAPHPSCPGLPGGPAPLPAQQPCPAPGRAAEGAGLVTGVKVEPPTSLPEAPGTGGSTQSSQVTLGRMMCWAKHVQEKLLLSPGILHGHQKPVSAEYSQYLLKFMAQPALQRPGTRDEHRQAVHAMLCVTHDGQPTLQQLPSPVLFTRSGDSELRLFWKDVDGTWSSLMQHWVEVKWIATSPAGQWVLGLKAADSARPAAVSLGSQHHLAAPAAATPPPPYPQQQGAGVQQASMARQPAPAAPESPAFPAAAPALLSGPEPHLGHPPCPGGAQGASHGAAHPLSAGPAPSNADGSGQAAADTLQGQGEVPGRTAAGSYRINQSGMEGRSGPGPATACQTGVVTEPGIKPEPGLQPGACGTAETGQARGTREEPIELSDNTGDEADADDEQDMDVMEPMSGDDAPQPAALPEISGTAAHGQAPVAPDGAGPASAPGPATAPGSLAAAALVDAAGPGNDPLPHVPEWSSYCVGARTDLSERCLERVPRLVVKHLGLELEARPSLPILVALALERPHALGADHGHGSLHLLYVVRPDSGGKWSGKKRQLNAWVTNSRFQLTGRFKAQRAGPEQGGPHLLVLEVQPLPQAAAQAACATPAHSRAAAIPGQPGCSAQSTAGVKQPKCTGTEQDVSEGSGKRHSSLVPCMLCVGGGEADPDQDQEAAAQKVVGAQELQPAALTGLPTTRGVQGQADLGLRRSCMHPVHHAMPPTQQASLVAVSRDAVQQQLLDAPPAAPHASPFSSAECPAPHARDGVVGQADPGSQGSSLRDEHGAATPLHQPWPWIDCIVCKREEEEHPQPASLADDPAKLLAAAQPAVASTSSLAQAIDAGSRTEPDGGQGSNQAPHPAASDPACPSVEADSAQPETVLDCLMMAEALQQQLLAGECAWLEAAAPVPAADSLHILTGMATAASKVDLQSGRDSSMVPVVCVPWDVALEARSWGQGAPLAGVAAPLPAAAAATLRPEFVSHPPQEIQTLQMEAVAGQQALVVAITPGPQDGSHHTRHLMATAAPRLEWHSARDTSLDAAVCVRHRGQSTSPQLPPPFLARIHGSSWELLWKAPDFPWSSMLQLWEAIKWVGKARGGSLVLGLRAASSPGSTALDPTSMHTPQVPAALPCPPPHTPHQQGQGAQLAATARQMPVTACGAATPPVATPTPLCGPGPLHGRQDCSDVKPDPEQQPDPMAAKDLVVTVGAMMDEHLPASEVPMFKEAYKCMEEWVNSPHGAAQLEALRKAYTWNLLMFEGRTSKTTAWTLWESIQCILGQTPAATSSSDAAPDLGPEAMEVAPAALPESSAPAAADQGTGAMQLLPGAAVLAPAPPPELPGASTHDLAAMQEELVGHSALPGTQSVTTQWQAAAVAATAWPEADPQPHIDSWTQLKGFTDRSLEYLPKPLALQFGLHESGADKVELLVVLVHPSGSTCADQGQLPYEATRRPDGRWSMKARSPQSVKISTWVKNCGLALTGRCKAQRAEPGQAVERLLVLEVRPLSEAAASAGQATPGVPAGASGTSGAGGRLVVADAMAPPIQAVESGAVLPSSLGAAGPAGHPAPPLSNMGSQGQQQPCVQPVAAYGHVAAGATMTTTPPDSASYPLCDPQPEPEHGDISGEEGSLGPGYRTGMKRKAADADADADQSPEAGQAAAAASVKRHLGCRSQEPDLVGGVPQPGGAAGAAGLGTTEEEGSGLSQPAAGMECAPDEGDPEVSQPAAAPAHAARQPVTCARPLPDNGQSVIDLTQEEPDTPQGFGAMLPAPKIEAPSLPPHPEVPGASTHDLAAMHEELVGQSPLPGTQSMSSQWHTPTVVATAGPEADPQPHVDSWTQLKGFTDRSLEYLPKPLALQFGLHECGADKVELLVVLVHPSGSTGADQGPGCLQLPYEATRRPDGRWSLKARSPQSVKISTWVKSCRLALTGRCKAQRAEPGQAKERLLVLEVRPLSEAAASAGQATPGTAQGPGALPRAPGAEAQPPDLQAELPGVSSSMTSADAATASNAAAAAAVALEEEGPHPSHPVATGTPSGGSALRARLSGSGREDVIDLTIEEPEVKPDPGPRAAKGLILAVVNMLDKHLPASELPMLADAYMRMEEWLSSPHGAAQLEALRKVYAATLLKCAGMSSTMIAWTLWKSIQRLLEQTPAQTPALNAVGSGAVPSPAVAAAPSQADLSLRPATDGRPSKRTRSGQAAAGSQAKIHCGVRRQVLSLAADQNQDMAAVEPLPGAEAPPPLALQVAPGVRVSSEATLSPAARQSMSTGLELAAVEGRMKGSSGSGHCETSDTSDEADTDDDQDMDVMAPMSGYDAPLPAALPEVPGTAAHGQAPVAPDVAGPSSAPGPAAAPGSLAAAALVAAAGPGVDPLPHVRNWGTYSVGARCLEVVQIPIVEQLGLDGFVPGSCVPILVALALEQTGQPHAPGGHQGLGSLHLLCVATLSCGVKVRWRLRVDTSIHQSTVYKRMRIKAWVRDCNLQMTGRFKARRAGLEQGGPHLLVLEVRPLPRATLLAGPATPGGESGLSSGRDFRQQSAAGAPWSPGHDPALAAAAQTRGGATPTGWPTPCMAPGQAVPGVVQAMAPPLAAQGPPLAGLPGLPSTEGMLGKRGARYQGNHGALLPRQGMGNGPASAITTPQAGQAVPPGRQVATRSGPMSCAQIPVQQSLGTACPLSSPGLLAAPLLMPDCVRVVLNKAQQLQDLLLVSRGAANDLAMQHNVDATLLRDLDLAFLPFLSQPARPPNWNIRREGQLVVLVCVPSNGLPTLQRPPPPFLVSCLGNSVWELVWKAPDWPWGSVQQHWGKVEWVAKGPHQELVLGLQAAVRPGHVADSNSTPSSSRLHAAASPTPPTPQQQGPGSQGTTMMGQMEAAASEGHPSLALPLAQTCGSEPPPGHHAGNGVREAASRTLGLSRSGAVPSAAMPPCQAALLAVPGTPGIGSPASPHSQPATPASCPNPCLASNGGPIGNLEPIGGQQDGVQASDATDPACPLSEAGHTYGPKPLPNSVWVRVRRAEAVRQKLLTTRSKWDFALKPMSDAGSLYLLNFIAQPVPQGDWEEQDMDFVIPVVCVPHDGLSSPHQLPPPLLVRRLCDHKLELVWKEPNWPWSSVEQHWVGVMGTALSQGHMVVGLQASSNTRH